MQCKVTYLSIALVDENFSISGLYIRIIGTKIDLEKSKGAN